MRVRCINGKTTQSGDNSVPCTVCPSSILSKGFGTTFNFLVVFKTGLVDPRLEALALDASLSCFNKDLTSVL